MKAWLIIRLLFAVGCLGVSLLAFLPAPTIPLFELQVGVTEFGHWMALAPLALALAAPQRSSLAFLGTVFAVAACGFLLSSAVRAQWVARGLPGELDRAFSTLGGTRGDSGRGIAAPFRWSALWLSPPIRPVPVETREYAAHDGTPLSYRFYRSATRDPAPCVVVMHGGGWDSGTPDEFVSWNYRLAREGYAVAALEYRLAPRWPWPAQREDVLDAIRSLKENAGALGIDSQQFVLLGRSAGGQIAEATAYAANDPAIRGCISFYAPADLYFAYEFARDDDILGSLGVVLRFMGGKPGEVRGNYYSASAILLANRKSPPTLLLHGRRDELVWCRQSERLAARLQELGVPHALVELPWATHAFDYNPNGPGGQLAAYAVETFLARVTH